MSFQLQTHDRPPVDLDSSKTSLPALDSERHQIVQKHHERVTRIVNRIRRKLQPLAKGNPNGREAHDLAAVNESFEYFERAVAFFISDGLSAHAISQHQGLKNAPAWLRGTIPNQILRRDPKRRKRLQRPITLPVGESPEFAYILGAYLATVKKSNRSDSKATVFSTTDHTHAERLLECFQSTCSAEVRITSACDRKGIQHHSIRRVPVQLTDVLKQRTGYSTRVPQEFTLSRSERWQFLKGFFGFCGGTVIQKEGRYQLQKQNNPSLLNEVAGYLFEFGVAANVTSGQYSSLIINDQHQIFAFRDLKLLPNGPKRIRLDQLDRSHWKANSFQPDVYKAVRGLGEQLGYPEHANSYRVWKSYVAEHADRERIDLDTVTRFLNGKEPTSVKRERRVKAIMARQTDRRRTARIAQHLLKRVADKGSSPSDLLQVFSGTVNTLAEFAELTGLCAQDLEAWQTEKALPPESALIRMCSAFHCSLPEQVRVNRDKAEMRMVGRELWTKRVTEEILNEELKCSYPGRIPAKLQDMLKFIRLCVTVAYDSASDHQRGIRAARKEAKELIRIHSPAPKTPAPLQGSA